MALMATVIAPKQEEEKTMARPTSTDWLPGVDLSNMGWWDVVRAVQAKHGPNAVAEMANSGFFDEFESFSPGDRASLGGYIAARQSEQDGGGLGDFFSKPINAALATAGFGVGGTSGASAATGGGITPQTLALDAAGLAGGAGLAGLMGPAAGGAAAGGTASGAAGGTGLTAGAGGLGLSPTAAGAAGLSPTYASGALAPGYFGAETLALGGAAGAGLGAGGGAGAGASVPSAPGVGVAAPAASGGAAAAGGISSLLSSPAALGMAGGALLGGLGGSKQAGSITVEEGIPDWLQPYVKPALDKYSTQLQNYQIDPYGVMPSAMKEFQNTISGMYLDPSTNKYLEDYFKLGAERIKGSLSPSFGHMQAFGQHSGYNEALSRGLGDFSTGLYGGAYNKERDRQSQLTAAAPAFLGQASQAAFQPYSQYLQSVGSLGKNKDQPYFDNPFGNVLGGALTGGVLGGMFK